MHPYMGRHIPTPSNTAATVEEAGEGSDEAAASPSTPEGQMQALVELENEVERQHELLLEREVGATAAHTRRYVVFLSHDLE